MSLSLGFIESLPCLDVEGVKGDLNPFKLESMWLKIKGFDSLFNSLWIKFDLDGIASFKVA